MFQVNQQKAAFSAVNARDDKDCYLISFSFLSAGVPLTLNTSVFVRRRRGRWRRKLKGGEQRQLRRDRRWKTLWTGRTDPSSVSALEAPLWRSVWHFLTSYFCPASGACLLVLDVKWSSSVLKWQLLLAVSDGASSVRKWAAEEREEREIGWHASKSHRLKSNPGNDWSFVTWRVLHLRIATRWAKRHEAKATCLSPHPSI